MAVEDVECTPFPLIFEDVLAIVVVAEFIMPVDVERWEEDAVVDVD